ncbi:MAG: maleylpyruvate isomerase N-terminal domain-containing protein, partial [Steroidobacteraceae bacterium]
MTPTRGTARLPQALDFLEECAALHATIAAAPAAAWSQPTQFKGWTFDDVIGHLLISDHAALLAAQSREAVQAFFGRIVAAHAAGRSMRDYTRDWLDGCQGRPLLERWHAGARELAATYADFAP